jgi:cellulose synthase/poly-beta-1,6-N-acetylglucosamine synthase-like glycosyltransferase
MDGRERLWVLLSDTPSGGAQTALLRRSRVVTETAFELEGVQLRVTPVVGYEVGNGDISVTEIMDRANVATDHAAAFRDLQPSKYVPQMEVEDRDGRRGGIHAFYNKFRDLVQFVVTLLVGFIVPFLIYLGLGSIGIDVVPVLYLFIVISLLYTATFIWIEGFLAHKRVDPPPATRPEGAATAIIAAYLPNEALTIESTLSAFFDIEYEYLQVILAYNTPYDMEIESRLAELARIHSNFLPMKIVGSTSKSQNVNTALSEATGEIIGIFDADSMPEPQSFTRAWAWLTNGVHVVQGHNAIRNGDSSYTARTVAVEFEAMYAVNHPGRARLHGFGIFGGSNGYWQAQTLRSIRMRGTMLTEDIDSSMRLVGEGGVIVSDPHLVAWELAPTTVRAVWNQRMRWSQGWFQVSLSHALSLLRSEKFNARQKFGVFMMLIWREIYPWIAVQMFPLIAFMAVRSGGIDKIDWLVPIFILTTAVTLGIGPAESVNAYLLGTPELKKNKRWFWVYLLGGGFLHNEFLNAVARVAQFKEILKEKAWKVTPRQ